MLLPSKKDIAEMLGKKPEDVVVGYASSIADLFHAGHVAYLREAKNHCDYLIVGIVDDPTIDRVWKNKPVQSLLERYIQVASCVYADCVIPLSHEQDLRDSLLLLQPDVRFVGEEYKTMSFTGDDIEGIKIIYLPRQHSFSSTDLRRRVVVAEADKICGSDEESKEADFKEENEDYIHDVGKQDY
uniref:Ethanolamine-phosphate cytidylyltransferase n=1 Tax=Siphoviridae sp. ctYh54 TaxID=2826379 RepID=A0A8S5MDU7_9CAUD|nr:MAG TPA: ethanolamine-phosphate cytidylyltransferase [Siphoviridae sp. ctYh54]